MTKLQNPITLKSIKHARFLSEETNAFAANVYIKGKKAGYAKNDGRGGCTHVWKDTDFLQLWKEAETFVEGLPKQKTDLVHNDDGTLFSYKLNMGHLIDEMIVDDLLWKEIKKKFKTKILVFKTEGTFSHIMSYARGNHTIEEYKRYFDKKLPDVVFMNDLGQNEAVKLYKIGTAGDWAN
tara:strand:- start:1843 stop:2382 length:540 start_codon:yes stop_codon:yes gene_type:complete